MIVLQNDGNIVNLEFMAYVNTTTEPILATHLYSSIINPRL